MRFLLVSLIFWLAKSVKSLKTETWAFMLCIKIPHRVLGCSLACGRVAIRWHVFNVCNRYKSEIFCNLMHFVTYYRFPGSLQSNHVSCGLVIYWKATLVSLNFLACCWRQQHRQWPKPLDNFNFNFVCNLVAFDMFTWHIKHVVISMEEGIKMMCDLLAFVLCEFLFLRFVSISVCDCCAWIEGHRTHWMLII